MTYRNPNRFRIQQTEYPFGVDHRSTRKQALKRALEMGGDVTVEDWEESKPNAMNKWIIRHSRVLAAGRVGGAKL